MTLRVRLFASAAAALGCRELTLEMPPGASARDLLSALAERGGEGLRHCAVAVARQTVAPDFPLEPGQEIAVLPPVSGGLAIAVGPEPIAAEAVIRDVARADLGAVVLFLGTVRETTDGQPTAALEYEAYTEMAEESLAAIAGQAGGLWPGCAVAIRHRTGLLQPGEAAVAVAAAASHRGDAFSAARYCIERLKAEAPIWKKDHDGQGEGRWVAHP